MTPFAIDMRILPIDQLVSFERAGSDVIGQSGSDELTIVRDPFPVIRLDTTSFLLVDDQDRYASLVTSGLEQLPVQVCREDELTVASNVLAVTGYLAENLHSLVENHPDDLVITGSDAEPDGQRGEDVGPTPDGWVPVSIRFDSTRKEGLLVRSGPDGGFPDGLRLLFEDIDAWGQYRPLTENRFDAMSLLRDPNIDCTLYLPPIRLADLKIAARCSEPLPSDVIQVSYKNRILGIDFPVTVLKSDISLEEKQTFLDDLVALRRQSRRTSLVEGRVFILNR